MISTCYADSLRTNCSNTVLKFLLIVQMGCALSSGRNSRHGQVPKENVSTVRSSWHRALGRSVKEWITNDMYICMPTKRSKCHMCTYIRKYHSYSISKHRREIFLHFYLRCQNWTHGNLVWHVSWSDGLTNHFHPKCRHTDSIGRASISPMDGSSLECHLLSGLFVHHHDGPPSIWKLE
jgi:hypothetical protein